MNTKNTVRNITAAKTPTAPRVTRSARKPAASAHPASPNVAEPIRASSALRVEQVTDAPRSEPKATVTVRKPKPPAKTARRVRPVEEAAGATPVGLKTIISVKVDVGFGNQVYLRGEGAGLTWDKGVPAVSSASDLWLVTLPELSGPARFKVLVNDSAWSLGEDYTVHPGQCLTIEPRF